MGIMDEYRARYGGPEDTEDYFRRMRLGIYQPLPIPPITDGLANLGYRAEYLATSFHEFGRTLKYTYYCTMPNNWLRRHRIPMRRRKHARWIEDEYAYNHCSNCGYEFDWPEQTEAVCPQCEARMKGKRGEKE